jgi:hypothetical protein
VPLVLDVVRVLVGALALAAGVAVVTLAVAEALARVDGGRGERRPSIVFAFTIAALAALPMLVGRPLQSLVGGFALLVVVALPLAIPGGRRLLRSASVVEAPDLPASIAMAGVWILGAYVSWTTRLWDGALAHYGFSSSMARGVLPAEHPLFPGEVLKYHVGYDALVGIVVAATRMDVGHACELVATLCLALLVAVLRDAGRALAGRSGGFLAVLGVPLGYGVFAMCLADGWGMPLGCPPWFPSSWVSAPKLPPPVISNFFQHPMGTAMPIALALLVFALERPSTSRASLSAVGLALLSQTQIVFFAVAGLGIGLGVVVDGLLHRRPLAALGRGVVVAAALVPALAGGVLGGGGGALGELVVGRGYFEDGGAALLLRHLALFGLSLVALPFALARATKEPRALRIALVVMAVASFVVPNVMTYARSWDIVKFFCTGAFFANLLVADLLAALSRRRGRGPAVAVVVLLVAWTVSGALWLVRHGPLNGVVAFRYALAPPSAVGAALRDSFGDDIGPRERVLTRATDIWQLGFLVAGADWRAKDGRGFLLDRARADENLARARRAFVDMSPADLAALEVRWVLLSQKDVAALSPAGRARLDGDAFEKKGDVVVAGQRYGLWRVKE